MSAKLPLSESTGDSHAAVSGNAGAAVTPATLEETPATLHEAWSAGGSPADHDPQVLSGSSAEARQKGYVRSNGQTFAPWLIFRDSRIASLLGGLACAVVAWTLSAWQNMHQAGFNATTLIFDSGHYLTTTQSLTAYILGSLKHQSLTSLSAAIPGGVQPDVNPLLLLDGPLLPLIGSIVFTIMGKIPTNADALICVGIESACHAAIAALLFCLGSRLTGSKFYGLLCGLMWAAYPSAILACDSFMSELPSIVAHLFFVYVLARIVGRDDQSASGLDLLLCSAAGLSTALLFISKPASSFILLPTVVAAICLMRKRQKLRPMVTLAAGAVVPLAAWLLFTGVATGHPVMASSREPTNNVAKGSNVLSDGWGISDSIPTSEKKGAASALFEAWAHYPVESINLLARKPERLWLTPWNTFKLVCLGVPVEAQLWWHRLVIIAGIAGLFAMSAYLPRHDEREKQFISLACAATLVGTLVYLPFETQSRYGFGSMPPVMLCAIFGLYLAQHLRVGADWLRAMCTGVLCVGFFLLTPFALLVQVLGNEQIACAVEVVSRVLLAGLFVYAAWRAYSARRVDGAPLARGSETNGSRSAELCSGGLAVLLLLVVSVATVAHSTNLFYAREWAALVKPGAIVSRSIPLTLKKGTMDWALVMVDCDKQSADAEVIVNGHKLAQSLDSIYVYDTEHYPILQNLGVIAALERRSLDSMRQWRAAPCPTVWLNSNGMNEISVGPGKGSPLSVFGHYAPSFHDQHPLPALGYHSAGRVLQDVTAHDTRVIDNRLMAGSMLRGNRDLSDEPGKQTGEYRIYLVLGDSPGTTAPNDKGGANSFRHPDSLELSSALFKKSLGADSFGASPEGDGVIRLNDVGTAAVPAVVEIGETSHFRVKVNANAMTGGKRGIVTFECSLLDRDGKVRWIPGLSNHVVAGKNWVPIGITATIPSTMFPQKISSVLLRVTSSRAKKILLLRNVSVEIQPVRLPLFAHQTVELH